MKRFVFGVLHVIDFIESIPSNILFCLAVAWHYATWPFWLLWYKWQGYQAHKEIVRYLQEVRSRAYYHEDM